MNDKLKKLAHKMLEFFTENIKTPTDIYVQLTKISKNQKEYFEYLGPSSMIKLTIYIYCFQNFKDLKLADKLIDRLLFAEVFYHSDEDFIEECDNCNGTGNQRCETCLGDGETDCGECDGSGEDAEGSPCDECQGGGRVECYNCDGSGETNCDDCGGRGELNTDNTVYYIETICTWNNKLKSALELNQGEPTPSLSDSEYDSLSSEYIKLFTETRNLKLSETVKNNPDEVFCVAISDEPILSFGYGMFLITKFKDYDGMSNFMV